MRNVLAASGLVVLFGCTGGAGELPDQGADQAGQGGGVQRLPGQPVTSSDQRGSSGSDTPSTNATTSPTSTATPAQQSISSSEFSRSCNFDSDCVAVFQGSLCRPCKCPNSAIASKDRSSYDQKLAERSASCGQTGDVQCSPCQSVTATCDTQLKSCTIR